MKNSIFNSTVRLLEITAKQFNITYEMINVIIWYMLLPFYWLYLIYPLAFAFYLVFTIGFIWGYGSFKSFCNIVFTKSVSLLVRLAEKLRISYELSSIIFCIVIPIIITFLLLLLL